ncbi:hypothetical protein PR003_g6149 [Phytophthora rubi]|uniref:Uncharacterized protein n=1 Tax=Phytophthora rubi TaxID=129364 RepID=A0A6A4FXP5_9STRA|nr:hypothetical protein PR003_g6149 [Phytophthora rubi]
MSDGWKDGTTHFVAVIAVFMQGEEAKEILLGFSPPLEFGLVETGYPPPLKEGATAPSTLGTRGCLMAFT